MNGSPDPMPASDRLGELFTRHSQRLYRLARRLAPSADAARDLVQDTFLKTARHLHKVPAADTDAEAWLVRVLVNVRRDQWRRERVQQRHEQPTAPEAHNLEAAWLARAEIWRALDRLSPRRRAILVLYELEGCPVPSIAALLNLSAVTVRWHLSRGRRELARVLQFDTGDAHADTQSAARSRRSDPSRTTAS